MPESKPHSIRKWDGDDPRMEPLYRAIQFGVSLGLYDEVQRPAEEAVGDLIAEHNTLVEQLEAAQDVVAAARNISGLGIGAWPELRAALDAYDAGSYPASGPKTRVGGDSSRGLDGND